MKQQRRHFRLEFATVKDRPKYQMGKDLFEVIDLSEGGMKYKAPLNSMPNVGSSLQGVVVFPDGKTKIQIDGHVLRIDTPLECVVVQFSRGIPLSIMMEKHREMIAKYKK